MVSIHSVGFFGGPVLEFRSLTGVMTIPNVAELQLPRTVRQQTQGEDDVALPHAVFAHHDDVRWWRQPETINVTIPGSRFPRWGLGPLTAAL